jgi:hypothetical protein
MVKLLKFGHSCEQNMLYSYRKYILIRSDVKQFVELSRYPAPLSRNENMAAFSSLYNEQNKKMPLAAAL